MICTTCVRAVLEPTEIARRYIRGRQHSRMVEDVMAKNKPTNRFWFVLAAVNLLVVSYPIGLLHTASTSDVHLFATLVLIGCVFLLAVVDSVSIVMADELAGIKSARRRH